MDTIKQSFAALIGSLVLAGCLGNTPVASALEADQTEQSSEDETGDATTSLRPAFRFGLDVPAGTEVSPQWGAGSRLAGARPAFEAGRRYSAGATACPPLRRSPGDAVLQPDRRRI